MEDGTEDGTEGGVPLDPPMKGTSNSSPSPTGEVWTDTSWLVRPSVPPLICEGLWWAELGPPFAKEARWPCNRAIRMCRSSTVLSS